MTKPSPLSVQQTISALDGHSTISYNFINENLKDVILLNSLCKTIKKGTDKLSRICPGQIAMLNKI